MSNTNPIDSILAGIDASPASNPPVSQVAAAPKNDNPVDDILHSIDSPGTKSSFQNTTESALPKPGPSLDSIIPSYTAPSSTGNPVNDILKQIDVRGSVSLAPLERAQSAPGHDTTTNEDEPWYSQTWDWLNRPLFDAHQWGVRTGAGSIERGIESGVEDLVSGFTSPLSIALTIGTLGGSTLEKLGVEGLGELAPSALKAIGVGEREAPYVAKGIKSLIDAGFTVQQVQGVITQAPQVLDALKDGDYETATRLATTLASTTALSTLGARKIFEDAGYVQDYLKGRTLSQAETLRTLKGVAGRLDEAHAVSSQKARELAADIKSKLEAADALDSTTQGAIKKWMLANGDRQLLRDQHDVLAGSLRPQTGADFDWSSGHKYVAVDSGVADHVLNSGINPKRAVFDTPEEALEKNGSFPEGSRVFAIPQAEVGQKVIPSHEVVLDDQGKPTGEAVPLRVDSPYALASDRTRFESEYTPAEKEQLLAQYKKALDLTPEQEDIAQRLRAFYEAQFERANKAGIIKAAVENYHPQAWANDRPGLIQRLFGPPVEGTDNAAYSQLRHQTDNGAFDTSVSAAKHRAFETEFQGELAGYKNLTNDLAYHAANYQNGLDRAIAARKFLEDLRASGTKAGDGRPLVALNGSSRVVGEESGNPALLVYPKQARQIAISHDLIQDMAQRRDPFTGQSVLKAAMDRGVVERLPFTRKIISDETGEYETVPAYGWSTYGYESLDHPSMRDWRYIGGDTDGNPVLLKGDMRIHPDAVDYVRRTVGADISKFQTSPFLRTLMAASREAKGALLSFSPFHAVQEGLRGVMLGINPFDWRAVDVEGDPLLRLGVRNNLTFPAYHAEDMFSDGVASHSKLIGKLPGLGRLQEQIQEFTFNKLIPSLKARAFKSVYYRFLDKMPGAGADEVAHSAATYVNDVFGGQHWRDLGISAGGQDMMRAVALAPDWLTSEIRNLYRVAGGMGKPAATIARQDMLRLTAGLFVTARVLNMLSTGSPHPEAPFGLVVPGGKGESDKVYSLRTLPTDLIHAMTDPRGFVQGRVNPLTVRTGIEYLTKRDSQGRKVTPASEADDFIRNVIPIGVQNILRGTIPGSLTELDQVIKAAGATVYQYKTEAEKLAQEKASDHASTGPVNPEDLKAHQQKILLEDALRSGEISRGQVLRISGLSGREANEIIRDARMTPLQARFNRLPLRDALDVFAIATPKEKDDLHTLLWQKRRAYIQTHTSRERAIDPVWRKLQSVYGDVAALQQPAR